MKLARWIFLAAAIYGLAVLIPGFFMEARFNAATPPAITHPEFYYGFYGCALAFQCAFLVIASDPIRYRPLMPVAMLEKLTFFAAALALYADGRMGLAGPFFGAMIDGALMILFAVAWLKTPRTA